MLYNLNKELQQSLDKVVKLYPVEYNFHKVFGADCFIKQYPTLFTEGLFLCKLKNKKYYIVVNNQIVNDTAFFSEQEILNYFVSQLFDEDFNFDHPSNIER